MKVIMYLDVSCILGDVCKGFLAAEQYRPEIIHINFPTRLGTAHAVAWGYARTCMCIPVPWLGRAGACKHTYGGLWPKNFAVKNIL